MRGDVWTLMSRAVKGRAAHIRVSLVGSHGRDLRVLARARFLSGRRSPVAVFAVGAITATRPLEAVMRAVMQDGMDANARLGPHRTASKVENPGCKWVCASHRVLRLSLDLPPHFLRTLQLATYHPWKRVGIDSSHRFVIACPQNRPGPAPPPAPLPGPLLPTFRLHAVDSWEPAVFVVPTRRTLHLVPNITCALLQRQPCEIWGPERGGGQTTTDSSLFA